MAQKHPWYWAMALPLVLVTACTGVDNGSVNTVNISVQAQYEKRDLGPTGFGSATPRPARYAYVELRRDSDGSLLDQVELDANGVGPAQIPKGVDVFAVLYADVVTPAPSGTGFLMYGNVKRAVPSSHFATADALNAVPTWYTTSPVFNATSSGTITLKALESTSEAGAFAIADQMVEFALAMGQLEPTLTLPNIHTFWNTGTVTTYPTSDATATTTGVLQYPKTDRPMLVNEIRFGTPWNDAYNDSLLLETFAHSLFAYGSYWSTDAQGTQFGSLVRSDGDPAKIDPFISSESTMAFASGFGNFLSCAIRNDPNLYSMDATSDTLPNQWRIDQHQMPTTGGEFFGSSVARSMWGIWKNGSVFNGSQAGLTTMWNATIPSVVNQAFEFGNAPLGCYPTYLVGLTRLAATQGGNVAGNAIRAELALENVGNGYGDVTVPGDPYYTTNPANPLDNLWITNSTLPLSLSGTLRTYDSSVYGLIAYDQDQSQAFRIYHDGTDRTITLNTSSSGLLVELFDSLGYLANGKAPGSTNTISLAGIVAGNYVVRVRLDPSKSFTGADAAYTLTVQ